MIEYKFIIVGGTTDCFTIDVEDSEKYNNSIIWNKAIEHAKRKNLRIGSRGMGIYCYGWEKDGEYEDSGFEKTVAHSYQRGVAFKMLKNLKDPIPYLKMIAEAEGEPNKFNYLIFNIIGMPEYKKVKRISIINDII